MSPGPQTRAGAMRETTLSRGAHSTTGHGGPACCPGPAVREDAAVLARGQNCHSPQVRPPLGGQTSSWQQWEPVEQPRAGGRAWHEVTPPSRARELPDSCPPICTQQPGTGWVSFRNTRSYRTATPGLPQQHPDSLGPCPRNQLPQVSAEARLQPRLAPTRPPAAPLQGGLGRNRPTPR